jgi:hypothetical protein
MFLILIFIQNYGLSENQVSKISFFYTDVLLIMKK